LSRRLAIVVATDPESGDIELARELAGAALAGGVQVDLFLMDQAVAALRAPEPLVALARAGCSIAACEVSTSRHSLPAQTPEIALGSQDDHARMVARADRVLAFT